MLVGGFPGLDKGIFWNVQVAQVTSHRHVIFQAPSKRRNLAAVFVSRIEHLLDARNKRSKSGDNNPALGIAKNLVESLGHDRFAWSHSGRLDMDTIAHQEVNAPVANFSQLAKLGHFT